MDSSEQNTCHIKNEFHSSKEGCSFITTADNRRIHNYNKTKISISSTGCPLYTYVPDLKIGVEVSFVNINSVGGQVSVLVPDNFQPLEQYLSNLERCLDLILELKKASDFVSKCIKTNTTIDNVALAPKVLFDCYVKISPFSVPSIQQITDTAQQPDTTDDDSLNEILFFRPVSFCYKTWEYFAQFQTVLFNIFSLTADNIIEQRTNKNPNYNDEFNTSILRRSTGKNQKVCNAAYFVNHPSELLECRMGSKEMCPHIAEFDTNQIPDSTQKTGQVELPKCKKLWKKLLAEGTLQKLIKFECQHPPHASPIIQEYFGRSHRLHTLLCFPTSLLDARWLSATIAFLQSKRNGDSFKQKF